MRIGFDAKRAFFNTSGLGNYSRYTINGLCEQFPEEEYLLYTPKLNKKELFIPPSMARVELPNTAANRKLGAFWRSYALSNRVRSDEVDIYHGLSNELPNGMEYNRARKVVTMHDLIFMRFPKLYSVFDRYVYYKKSLAAVRSADLIVAISEQTKADLIELLGADESKIRKVYQGCHPWFYEALTEEKKAAVRARYELPETYLLSVGTIEERKNLLGVVKGMHAAGIDIPLVAVGKQTAYFEVVRRYVQEKKMRNIFFLNYVASEDLPALYQSSTAFVYPSKYEGFGIPVLEALNSGVPVVTSRGGCLEETGGDSAILVDPENVEDIAEGLRIAVYDEAMRDGLLRDGKEHALNFRQEKTIPELMKVYKELQ